MRTESSKTAPDSSGMLKVRRSTPPTLCGRGSIPNVSFSRASAGSAGTTRRRAATRHARPNNPPWLRFISVTRVSGSGLGPNESLQRRQIAAERSRQHWPEDAQPDGADDAPRRVQLLGPFEMAASLTDGYELDVTSSAHPSLVTQTEVTRSLPNVDVDDVGSADASYRYRCLRFDAHAFAHRRRYDDVRHLEHPLALSLPVGEQLPHELRRGREVAGGVD